MPVRAAARGPPFAATALRPHSSAYQGRRRNRCLRVQQKRYATQSRRPGVLRWRTARPRPFDDMLFRVGNDSSAAATFPACVHLHAGPPIDARYLDRRGADDPGTARAACQQRGQPARHLHLHRNLDQPDDGLHPRAAHFESQTDARPSAERSGDAPPPSQALCPATTQVIACGAAPPGRGMRPHVPRRHIFPASCAHRHRDRS